MDLLLDTSAGFAAMLVFCAVPLLVIRRSRRRESRKAVADGTQRISPVEETLALDATRRADPGFAPDKLLARTPEMFHRIQEAQRAQSWGVARSYLS